MPGANTLHDIVDTMLRLRKDKRPSDGVVHAIDGDRVDIRLGDSTAVIRHVEVSGSVDNLTAGAKIQLRWGTDGRPVVLPAASGSPSYEYVGGSTEAVVVPDNITIENSSEGLRVKQGGIGREHLNFPVNGGNGSCPLTSAGWNVSAEGVLSKEGIYIHPHGEISVGQGEDVVKLSAWSSGGQTSDEFRLWVGHTIADNAPFRVTKLGELYSTLGLIAGWNIREAEFFADDGNARLAAGTHPYLGLGGATQYQHTGIWLGKDGADHLYKLFIGDTGGSYMQWDGTDLTITGTLYATVGEIGGWTIGTDTITCQSGQVGLNSEETGGTDWRFWAGHATPGSAPFRVDESGNLVANSATIGGWTVDSDEIKKLSVDIGIVLDSTTPKIQVGDVGGTHIVLDGANENVRSSNYSAGETGFGIAAYSGDAEFNNIVCRGEFRTVILTYEELHAVAGDFGVFYSAGKVRNDFVTPGSINSTVDVNIDDPATGHAQMFQQWDIVRVKTGTTSAWFEVTAVSDQTTYYRYTFKLKSGATSATVRAGTAVIDYGPNTGGGFLIMRAQKTTSEGPYYSVQTHTGAPYTTTNERVRLGNLDGSFGISSELYGIGIGDYSGSNYLRYDTTNGFQIIGADGGLKISSPGMQFLNSTAEGSQRSVAWYSDTGTDMCGRIVSWEASNINYMRVRAGGVGEEYAKASVQADPVGKADHALMTLGLSSRVWDPVGSNASIMTECTLSAVAGITATSPIYHPDPFGPFMSLSRPLGVWRFVNRVGSATSDSLVDVSGCERHLSVNGSPEYTHFQTSNYPYIVYSDLDGSNDWFSRSDETAMDNNVNFSAGGWFWIDSQGTAQALMGKWGADPNNEWIIQTNTTSLLYLYGSANGTDTVISEYVSFPTAEWFFVGVRFVQGSMAGIYMGRSNGWTSSEDLSVSSIYNGTADFTMGAQSGGGFKLNGRCALAFWNNNALSEAALKMLFFSTRDYFGV